MYRMAELEFLSVSDSKQWDQFVQSQDRYSFVQSAKYTWVLETMAEGMDRIGVYLNNRLIALLPLATVAAKRGRYIRLWHGPILSPVAYDVNILEQIFVYLEGYAKKHKANFVRIHPIGLDKEVLLERGLYSAPTHNLDAEHTLQLLLNGRTVKDVFAGMRKNTRYYIRKADREETKVITANNDFENFYKLLSETAKRQGYTLRNKKYFHRLFEAFNGDGLTLYFAEVDGEKIGIGLFLDYGKYRFYLEGGMNPQFSKNYPAYAIQGQSIMDAVEKRIEIYDFWGGISPKDQDGVTVKNYPWAGIDLFKRGFGGEEVSMVHPHDLVINSKYWFTWLFETIDRKRKGY